MAVVSPARAETPDLDELLDKPLKQLMDVPVISASRQATSVVRAPANVTVITQETIRRRGYRNITEILRDLPGFDIVTGQPAGEYPTHIRFRGQGGVGQSKLLIMHDGVIVNETSNGWATGLGFDNHLGDLERIEVISGPGSALYGSNAFVGVINYVSKPGSKRIDQPSGVVVEASVTGGMHFTIAPELLMAFKFDNGLSIQLSGRWYVTEGDSGLGRLDPGNYFSNNREPNQVLTTEHGVIKNEVGPDGLTARLADGFDTSISDISARALVEWGESFQLSVGFWQRDEGLASEVPGYEYFANTADIPFRVLHRGFHVDMRYTADLASWAKSVTRLYWVSSHVLPDTQFTYTYQYQSVDNGVDAAVPDKAKRYNGKGVRVGIEQQFDMELSDTPNWSNNLAWGFGFERREEQYFGISLGQAPPFDSTLIESTWPTELPSATPVYYSWAGSFFLSDTQQLGERLTLHAGLRIDLDTQVAPALNPRIALVANPIGGFWLKALYGTAFRAPTIFELKDEWRGNDNLGAERIHTAELELRYIFDNNVAFVALSGFYSRADNTISERVNADSSKIPVGPDGQKATYFQNGSGRNYGGFTLSGELRVLQNLRAYLNYTYLFTEDFQALDNVAQHKLNFGISYTILDKIDIDFRANWVGASKAPATNLYYHPKNEAWARANYDYVTAPNANGFADAYFVGNVTIRGKNLFGDWLTLEPVLMFRNVWDTDYVTLGRQSGSATRPVDQASVANPAGFAPAYHPQPGFEFLFKLEYRN